MDRRVVGDVVAVVFQWRWVEGEQPEGGHSQVLEVVQLLGQPAKVAYAVAVTILERANVKLVNDRVFVPERVRRAGGALNRAVLFVADRRHHLVVDMHAPRRMS